MQQGTTEWHSWRGQGIGSSDAAVIMGCDPYRSYEDLILDKLGHGKPFVTNPAIELGKKWEGAAREIFNFKMEMECLAKTFTHKKYEFMRASLDGWCEECFIEIKYVGQKKFDDAKKHGKIPEHHMVQMQHQHLVSDLLRSHYVCYTLDAGRVINKFHSIPVFYDEDYIRDKLIPAELKFWEVLGERRKAL